MILNHSILVNYFKQLATNLNDLDGFFRMDLKEILDSFRSLDNFPCMVVESHEGDFSNSNTQQSVNTITWAFTIYTNPQHDDYNEINTKLTTAEEIGIKILARMRHDATQPNHVLFRRFKLEDVAYSKIGPVFNEHLYGYRFTGQITIHEPLTINPEDWADTPTTCNT